MRKCEKNLIELMTFLGNGRPGTPEFKAKLAAAKMRVSRQALHGWIRQGRLPPARAQQIEKLTKGRWKAEDLIDPNWRKPGRPPYKHLLKK